MKNLLRSWLLFVAVIAVPCGWADATDQWPHWRGPHDNGSTPTGTYPVKWDTVTNVLWKVPLPGRGCSTPIVWNQRIVLTAPVEAQDAVLMLDWSGHTLWQSIIGPEHAGKHRNGSGSNPSPVTDGEAIYVYFKSGHFARVDWDGKLRWKTNLIERYGNDTLYWDYGSSPVLTEKDVVFAMLRHGDSFLAAFDKQTGVLHWKVARNYPTAVEGDHSYATPLLFRHQNRDALLVLGGEHLTAHAVTDGKTLWECDGFNPKTKNNWVPVASPVIAGGVAVVPYGRGTCLHGIKLADGQRLWKREDTGSFVPTPAEAHGQVYVLQDRGEIDCLDPATGQTISHGELPKDSPHYYASPVVADGKIYAAREDGVMYVASATGQFAVLAEIKMGERLIASPVPVANRLLIRGEKNLYCIGTK